MMRELWTQLRFLISRRKPEELDLELSFHLEKAIELHLAAGMNAAEARRQALIEFGGVERTREQTYEQRPGWWMGTVVQDVRYALRLTAKSPGFTAVAAGSLALAIGANTAIFSIAKEMLYDRLAVDHPEQLRLLGWRANGETPVQGYRTEFDTHAAGMTSESFSYPVFRQLQASDRSLQGLVAFEEVGSSGMVGGVAEPLSVEAVSGNYYSLLGVRSQLGRAILPSDDGAVDTGAVAVISEGLWDRAFGRSANVIGQTLRVDKATLTIVGVNPRIFTGAASAQQSPDLFVPMSMANMVDPWGGVGLSALKDPGYWGIEVMGRLRADVSESQAQAALDTELAAAVRSTMTVKPNTTMPRMVMADGARGLHQMDGDFRKPLNVLGVLVGLVLLLACANVANLQLARGTQRTREMSVRLALGSGRRRLLQQLLTENLFLAALGGSGGLLLGYLGRNGIPALLVRGWRADKMAVHFDWGIFVFCAVSTVLTGLMFGMFPAWNAARLDVSGGLKEGAQTATRRQRGLRGKALVGLQIALSTLLIIGAGLFVRTVMGLASIEPGFRTDHLLIAPIYPAPDRFPPKKNVQLMSDVERAIAAIPGVDAATAMSVTWLGGGWNTVAIRTEDEVAHPETVPVRPDDPGLLKATSVTMDGGGAGDDLAVRSNRVGNGFFAVMSVPIFAGRGFGPQDTATSQKVAVINQRLARERFPHGSPVGKRITLSGEGTPKSWIEVVGVCGDTLNDDLRSQAPGQFFLPLTQADESYGSNFMVRTHLPAAVIVPALRRAVAGVSSEFSIQEIRSQQEDIDTTMRMERALATLAAGFGALALALACVGIYGVMAYSVANRRNEIGIRLALGARPGQVRSMILRESAWLAVAGVIAGVAAALWLGRLVGTMLYGVGPYDPVTLVGGTVLLFAVALAAGWIPARRAAGMEPMDALRHE